MGKGKNFYFMKLYNRVNYDKMPLSLDRQTYKGENSQKVNKKEVLDLP